MRSASSRIGSQWAAMPPSSPCTPQWPRLMVLGRTRLLIRREQPFPTFSARNSYVDQEPSGAAGGGVTPEHSDGAHGFGDESLGPRHSGVYRGALDQRL